MAILPIGDFVEGLKVRMRSTTNVRKVKALMKTVPRKVVGAIGGPMLLGMLKQIDSFVKGAEKLSHMSFRKFKEDPLAALTIMEQVVNDVGLTPGEKENDDDDSPATSANEKLQVIYRRSLEYAAAHEIWAQKCADTHSALSFLCMVSATATSLLLFTSSNTENELGMVDSNTAGVNCR